MSLPLAIADGLTFALAVIGAITGSLSAAAAVWKAWQDRPRLDVSVDLTSSMDEPVVLAVHVLNDSPRATTVRKVGFYFGPLELTVERTGHAMSGDLAYDLLKHPVFLEAGEFRTILATPDDVGHGCHVDYPLRVYAVDARGRRVWGPAAPIRRMALNAGWKAQAEISEELLSPADMEPARVEPVWKFWKRAELRNPSAYRAPQSRLSRRS